MKFECCISCEGKGCHINSSNCNIIIYVKWFKIPLDHVFKGLEN
jgi:hypothetical protein